MACKPSKIILSGVSHLFVGRVFNKLHQKDIIPIGTFNIKLFKIKKCFKLPRLYFCNDSASLYIVLMILNKCDSLPILRLVLSTSQNQYL